MGNATQVYEWVGIPAPLAQRSQLLFDFDASLNGGYGNTTHLYSSIQRSRGHTLTLTLTLSLSQ